MSSLSIEEQIKKMYKIAEGADLNVPEIKKYFEQQQKPKGLAGLGQEMVDNQKSLIEIEKAKNLNETKMDSILAALKEIKEDIQKIKAKEGITFLKYISVTN